MTAATEPQRFLVVTHGQVGGDPDNPSVATIRLSGSKEDGPHLDFVATAPILERIAQMLTKAAADIRKRSN